MNAVKIVHPEDRRGIEQPLPPDWTLFDRARHEPPRGVIATLDDLTGWTAEAEGLSAAFGVTPALALWGKVGTFVEIAAASAPGSVTLRPSASIPIPAGADLFEIWVCGDNFDWQGLGPSFSLAILARPSGEADEVAVSVADCINWPTFALRIVKLPERLRSGGTVTGLRLVGCDPASTRRIGLDRLCAYRDERAPLALAPRPRRPLQLPAGQDPGLHTGPGVLPFPTREETILPDHPATGFASGVERRGNAFRFRYAGEDAKIVYEWAPAKDPLRVTMRVDGRPFGEALAGTLLGGAECVAWLASDWRGSRYAEEDPLSPEQLRAVPESSLRWRGTKVPACACDGAATDRITFPPYDIGRHGGSPIYHLYREIVADADMEVSLMAAPPREHTALWLNGELVPCDRLGTQPARTLWNGVWRLPLRRGRNLVVIRLILWSDGFCEFKPLPAGARWGDAWRVFGPATYNPGAEPPRRMGALPAPTLTLDGDWAEARFADGPFGPLTVRMRLFAKSLAIDVHCPLGRLAYLEPGRFRKLANPRLRTAPAMGINAVLLADTPDGRTFFCSLFHDWYRSNASSWTGQTITEGDTAALQGPLLYLPKTDGVRNGLFERYFLTCSPVYEEVLPNVANPPSPWAVEAGCYVFQESWGPDDFAKELGKAKRWAALGMTDILHLHHELGWSHQIPARPESGGKPYWVNDGCTLRLDIAPAKGGTAAMQQFLADEQALGLRAGLYTNYTDYYTLNSHFRSDLPILLSDGSRQPAWVHSYAMKPSLAVEFDAWFAPRIARRFHPTTAYTDVHTCVTPWARVDFDARVPGAATFAATYYAFGEILLNDQRHYDGPVFSEGGYSHWIYAGLVSGNYGQVIITADDPPNPTFNLLKVHPLETDVGLTVGTTGWITGHDNLDEQVDRYLMAVLTYGHIAYLPQEPFDARLLLRVYHMARAASMRYAGQRPTAIHYAGENGRWLTVSEAQIRGLDAHCRMRIVYPGGLTLYANWSRERPWRLADHGAGGAVLPTNGYLFESPQGIICASVLEEGRRYDRAETPGVWYADGRGRDVVWGPLSLRGSAALRIDPAVSECVCLVDGGGNERIRVAAPYAPKRYRAILADGTIAAERVATEDGAGSAIEVVPGAVRYEWEAG